MKGDLHDQTGRLVRGGLSRREAVLSFGVPVGFFSIRAGCWSSI